MADQVQMDSLERNHVGSSPGTAGKSSAVLYAVTSSALVGSVMLNENDLLIAEPDCDDKFVTCSAIFSEETSYSTIQVPCEKIALLTSLAGFSVAKREQILKFIVQANSTQAVSTAFKTGLLEGCGALSRGDALSHFITRYASDMVFSYIFSRLHAVFPFDLQNGESASILHTAVQSRNKAAFDGVLSLLKAESEGEKREFVNNRLDSGDTVLHTLAWAYSPDFRVDMAGLVRAGAELELENDRRTCFHVAAECSNSGFANAISEALEEVLGEDQAKRVLNKALEKRDGDDRVAALLAKEDQTLRAILRLSNLERPVFEDGRLIHYAAFTNDVLLCDCLVALGAVVDSFNNKSFTALKISSKKGHLEVTRSLLQAGANPNLVSKNPGFTALNNAAQFGHLECVRLLIEYRASIDSLDMATTPVHSAAYGGHVKVLDYFLKECCTDVNLLNTNGKVPLYQATIQGHTACVQLLLRYGANVNLTVSDQEETLVHIAVKENKRQVLRALLEHKAKPDEATKSGKTPLMLAVEQDNVDFIPLIMSYGITLIKKDSSGNTVFHYLAKHGSTKCAKYLLRRVSLISGVTQEYQLYKNKNTNDKSPFDIALENRHDKLLEQFIKYMPEQKKTRDQKMFHQLYDKGLFHIIRLIIRELPSHKCGAFQKVNSKFVDSNSEGATPEDKSFSPSKPSFLHKLASCPDYSLILHPLIDSIINAKYQIYRWWFVLSFLTHLFIFLPMLSFALIQGSYLCDDNLTKYTSNIDYTRLVCEVVVVVYASVNVLFNLLNFASFWHSLYQVSKNKQSTDNRLDVEFLNPKTMIEKFPVKCPRFFQLTILKLKELLSKLDSKLRLVFSAAEQYFLRPDNLLGIFGFSSLLILIALRFLSSHTQWIFAAIVFMSYSLSLISYAKINPTLGLYISVLLRIFYQEVPKFLCAFMILCLTCSGAMHLLVRSTLCATDSRPACNQTLQLLWFGENYHPIYSLLSPLFLLLNPGIGEGAFSLYRAQPIGIILFYFIFGFFISVFMLSVFVAQLTNSYKTIGNYEKLQFKLDTIIDIERNSIVSLVFGKWLRKSSSVIKVLIPKQKWDEVVLNGENSLPLYNFKVVSQETNRQVHSSKELVEKRMDDLSKTTDGLSNNVESIQDTLSHLEQFQTDIHVQLDSIRVALQHLQQTLVK